MLLFDINTGTERFSTVWILSVCAEQKFLAASHLKPPTVASHMQQKHDKNVRTQTEVCG